MKIIPQLLHINLPKANNIQYSLRFNIRNNHWELYADESYVRLLDKYEREFINATISETAKHIDRHL